MLFHTLFIYGIGLPLCARPIFAPIHGTKMILVLLGALAVSCLSYFLLEQPSLNYGKTANALSVRRGGFIMLCSGGIVAVILSWISFVSRAD